MRRAAPRRSDLRSPTAVRAPELTSTPPDHTQRLIAQSDQRARQLKTDRVADVAVETSERMAWMDTLRGIAVVLVILLHAGEGLRHYATSLPEIIDDVNELFEPYRMPTLAFLSGMLLQRSLAKNPARYLKGKAARVAWPYVVWSLIVLGVSNNPTPSELARIVYYPPTYLWYLYFLLIFYAVGLVLRRLPPMVLVAAGLAGAAVLPATWRLDKLAFLMAMFFLGDWVLKNVDLWKSWLEKAWLLRVCCGLVAVGALLDALEVRVLYETWYVWAVVAWLVIAIRLIPKIPAGRATDALNEVGRNSLIYYVSHLVPIKVLGTLLERLGYDDPWTMYPLLVATGLLAPTALLVLSKRVHLVTWLFAFPGREERSAFRSAVVAGLRSRRVSVPEPARFRSSASRPLPPIQRASAGM